MPSIVYDSAVEDIVAGDIQFPGDAVKVMLVSSRYTPDQRLHQRRADVIGEVQTQGYTPGGKTADVTVQRIAGALDIHLGGAIWPSVTIAARGAIYYKSTGNPALDPLIAYIDFNGNVISTNGQFSLTPSVFKFQTERA